MRGDTTTSREKQEGSATRGDATTGWCAKRWQRAKRQQCQESPSNNHQGQMNCSAGFLCVVAIYLQETDGQVEWMMVKRSVKGDGCEGRRRTAMVENCSTDLCAKGGECTMFTCRRSVRGVVSAKDDNGSASTSGKDKNKAQLKRW
jgi:hypothetical protein